MKEHTHKGYTILEHNELFYVFPYNAACYADNAIFHKGVIHGWYMFRANSLTGAKARINRLNAKTQVI